MALTGTSDSSGSRAVGNGIHFCDTTERAFKDYFLHIKGDSLVSQKWGETP